MEVVVFRIELLLKLLNWLLMYCFVRLISVFFVVRKEVLLVFFFDKIMLLNWLLVLVDFLNDFRCFFGFVFRVFRLVLSVFMVFFFF